MIPFLATTLTGLLIAGVFLVGGVAVLIHFNRETER